MSALGFVLHALLVGGLLAGAAWCLDRPLTRARVPLRWTWLAALGLAVAIPVGSMLVGMGAGEVPTAPPASMVSSAPADVEFQADGGAMAPALSTLPLLSSVDRGLRVVVGATPPSVDRWLALGWGGLSAGLLALLLVRARRNRRARSEWPQLSLQDHPVRLSPDVGPAVVGVVRPEIVLPERCRALPRDTLALVLAHEAEHLRARDPLLLAAGLLPVLAMPWNPFVWWMHRQLRTAVELDCDRRVLRTGVPAHRYGSTLVDLGFQAPSPLHAGAVLGLRDSRPTLERRLLAMKNRPSLTRLLPLALLGTVAASFLLVVACASDSPVHRPDADTDTEERVAADAPDVDDPSVADPDTPGFVPRTEEPRLQNAGETSAALQERKDALEPPLEESLTVLVQIYIDTEGAVGNALVNQSSGREDVDEATLAVARSMEFSPAEANGEPVAVWISLPVRFDAGTEEHEAADAPEVDDPSVAEPSVADPDTPSFVPRTEEPRLQNAGETSAALQERKDALEPPLEESLTVLLHIYIDTEGAVGNALVNQGSGREDVDEAALAVSRSMEFSPAEADGKPVAVWISLPVRFDRN